MIVTHCQNILYDMLYTKQLWFGEVCFRHIFMHGDSAVKLIGLPV